ncbi:class I SAM-dependent DNA methyltransferase [Zooshikella ganghwensis]|uniref:Class I SAM-dependent methyltransferase n=1 Tax=Zooshikella ganghwensis TaxID=202772 RepID=A0A4P9VQX9_9GAMM|nr:class I SAM-dependent methyltransferase [Zooshikella ganghwensis]RDH44460.1 class I SAM-dependent methyltransferase [Zooshikella ganghwensis]
MSESWDDYAEIWDSNPDVTTYANHAFESLLNTVNPKGLRILDFGCGTGQLTERLSPLATEIVALDSSPKMIEILQRKNLPNVDTLTTLLTESTLTEHESLHKPFDLIIASSVFGFLSHHTETVQLLAKTLKPNGFLIQWDWLKTDEKTDLGLTEQCVEQAFQAAELSIVSLSQPFVLKGQGQTMPVLMGIAQKETE